MFNAIVMDYEVTSPVALAFAIECEVGVLCNWRDVRNGDAFRLWVLDDITAEQSAQIYAICARFQ